MKQSRNNESTVVRNSANPYSTGGGGYSYEQRVYAYFLAHLLRGTDVIGIDDTPNLIKFQQLRSGNLLDDIVVCMSDGQDHKTMYAQIRTKVTISKNNADFTDIIHRCYDEFRKNDFNKEADRLCIIVSHYPQNVRDHFIPILNTARRSSSADGFLNNINSDAYSKKKHDYLRMIRELLARDADVSDDDLWMFVKVLYIKSLDMTDGSSDYTRCIDLCKDALKTVKTSEGRKLFAGLANVSSEFSKNSGEIDWITLKDVLADYPIEGPQEIIRDAEILFKHGKSITANIRDRIGGLFLSRNSVITEVKKNIDNNIMLVLTGQPYVGKSVILKLLAEHLYKHYSVMVFSVENLNGINLDDFLRRCGIKNSFNSILHALPQPCYVLIDGFDKLPYNTNKITIINELLSAIQSYNNQKNTGDVSTSCRIVATCRAEEFKFVQSEILSELNLKNSSFEVPPLSDDELEHIRKNKKELNPILEKKHLAKILKIPGYLHILCGSLNTNLGNVPEQITESWFYHKFWEVMVRRSEGLRPGKGDAFTRAKIVKQCGKAALEGGTLSDELLLHKNEINGLVSDKILRCVSDTVVLSNDVFEDYALAEIIRDNTDTICRYLSGKEKSGKLQRAFNLHVSRILEVDCSAEQYCKLLHDISSDKSLTIWRHECISALVLSVSLSTIIPKMRELLLEDNGALLTDVLKTLYSVAQTTKSTSTTHDDANTKQNVDARYSVPLHEQWDPVIEFILDEFETLDDSFVLEFCKNIVEWMITSQNKSLKSRIGQATINFFERKFENNIYSSTSLDYKENDMLKERIIMTVILATESMPDNVAQFLDEHAMKKHESIFEDIVLRYPISRLLCKYLPETTMNLIISMMCREPPKSELYGSIFPFDLGLETFYQIPTPYEGPFYYFLHANPRYGLKTINKIVNHATDMWKMKKTLEKRHPLPQTIQISEKIISVYGDETVYGWFRLGNVSAVLTIVLMALEQWMDNCIIHGVSPANLFEIVLENNNSVAVVGVCLAVALKHHSKTLDAALPFLANPAFWHMDHKRYYEDLQMDSKISLYGMYDYFDQTKKCDILRKQASEVHRQRHIGSLVGEIIFTGSKKIKHKLREEMEGFVGRIPYFFEDEKDNTKITSERRRNCELWFKQTEKKNYRLVESGKEDTFYVEFDPDKHLTNEEKSDIDLASNYLRLNQFMFYAEKFNRTAVLPEKISLNTALEYVESFDESFESAPDDHKLCMVDARAHFICALVAHKWNYILNRKGEQWCLDQIDLILSQNPSNIDIHSSFKYSINHAVARALPYILLRFPKKKRIKNDILRHSRIQNAEILQCLFSGLTCLWNVDDKLVLKCITNVVDTVKDKTDTYNGIIHTRTNKLESLLYVFMNQNDILSQRTRQKIKMIFERLLEFTFDSYLAGNGKSNHNKWHLRSAMWNLSFFKVICMFVTKHPEEFNTLLDKIDDKWQECPEIMVDFVFALLDALEHENKVGLFNIWQKCFKTIMESDAVRDASISDKQMNNLLGSLIFVNQGKSADIEILRERTDVLVKHVDVWCKKLSHIPDCLSHLVTFLDTAGKHVLVPHGINWLCVFVSKLDENGQLEQKIGMLADMLTRIWDSQKNSLQRESSEYEQFVEMVELLASKKNRQAELIRDELRAE